MLKKNPISFSRVLKILLLGSLLTAPAFAYDKSYTAYMSALAHIDTAWQWTTATTINDFINNTVKNQLALLDVNSDYNFNISASVHVKWLKQYFPDLYARVKTKVANGQISLMGGQYVEPDLNIPSGESLVRQSLFGQRYFQQEFGVKSSVGWVPDTFGFSGQFPQILKKSGMDYFYTAKLTWNDTNNFPFELFKWQGIDGTQVIADKVRVNYDAGNTRDNVNYSLDNPNRQGIKKAFITYGAGDRGGGPDQAGIDQIRSFNADSTMPTVKMASGDRFFKDLTDAEKAKITDVWVGEMYLEQHRGTYTTQGLIKKNNRLGEIAAAEAEQFSSIASWLGAVGYPQSTINSAWEKILQNQFHDILPGSGTTDQAKEAWVVGQTAIDSLNAIQSDAMAGIVSKIDTTVTGVPVVVFNTLSFGRMQAVETDVSFAAAPTTIRVLDNGVEIPSQILSTNGNTAHIVFIIDGLQPVGYKVVDVVPNTGNYSGSTGLSIGANVIESNLFRVEINASTGNVSRIYDKTNSREVLSGEGNVLQVLEDTPGSFDAWNVDYDDMTRAPLSTLGVNTGITIVENGPVKCTYRINKSYGSSSFSQYITLYPNINRVDVRMTANWHESHKMLKVAFPFNVSGATSVTYETAFGTQVRSNQRDTSFNKARFEVSAHKWADLSNGGYGVSLLNNCKYGYDTYLNTMRLSLLRSPQDGSMSSSAPFVDQGNHEFTYSIYPHTGDWKTANTVFKGYELNYPLRPFATSSHTGTLAKDYSFFKVNQGNIIIAAIKKAEDSNDLIIRAYESQGIGGTAATFTLPGTISAITETNLLEEATVVPSYSGNTFSATFGPYDIRTFKVNCGGTAAPADSQRWLNKAAPGGIISASADNGPYEDKTRAFDGNYTEKWLARSATGWVQYQFANDAAWAIDQYALTSGADEPTRDPKNWILKGSNDGSTWVNLDTRSNESFADRTVRKLYSFNNSVAYKYYRLDISANNGATLLQLAELELYATNSISPLGTNFALNKTASANQSVSGEDAAKAVDGVLTANSKWCSNAAGDKWLRVDLGQAYTISRWVVQHAGAGGENTVWNTRDFKLQQSSDGVSFSDVDVVSGNTANVTDRSVAAFSARYVQLYITVPTNNTDIASRIYEFAVYGSPVIQVNLATSYNQDALSGDADRSDGNFDNLGYSYSADLVSQYLSFDDVSYALGSGSIGANNVVKATGQIVALIPGNYSSIRLLGAASNGDKTGTIRITYSDNSTSDVSVTMKDWCGATAGQIVALAMPHRHMPSGDQTINTNIYAYYLAPSVGKTVSSITLPNNADMHVFAVTLVP